MPKIYGELEEAQIENLSTDPTNLPDGRTWYNTTSKKPKIAVDGAAKDVLAGNVTVPASGTLATLAGVEQFTNKDINGGTASNTSRITLPQNTLTNLTGLTRRQGTLVYDTTSNKPYYDDGANLRAIGSGSGGTGNLIDDGDAEAGISNYITGSYSAAARPAGTFTISSGTGSFDIAASASSPLFGNNSFILTKSSGSSRQGRAIERTIDISAGYRAKVLEMRINYQIVSGTFVAGTSTTDSSLIWYIGQFNGSTWTYTEPTTFKMLSNSTSVSDILIGNFQTNSDTTQIKLIAYVAETANSAWVVKCEVGIQPCSYVFGTQITDWTSYAPTFTGFGSPTSINFRSRRVGDSLQVLGSFQAGVTTATLAQITLGYGGSNANVTSASWLTSGGQVVGHGNTNASITTNFSGLTAIAQPSLNYINVGNESSTLPGVQPLNGSTIVGNSGIVHLSFQVPIQGWQSNVQISDGYDARIVGLFQRKSSGSHSATGSMQDVGAWDTNATLDIDDVVSFNKTTGEYTFKRAGRFKASAAIAFAANVTGSRATQIVYDGTSIGRSADIPGSSTSPTQTKAEGLINAQAGKILKVQARQDSGANLNYHTDPTQTYLIIEEVKSPQTISATELVAVSVNGSSTSAAGAITTIQWANKTTDTHGAFNSNEFIVPVSGWYITDLNVRHNGGAGLAVNQVSLGYIQTDTGGGYSTVRQSFKYVENTGVASFSSHAHYEDYLKAGTKIRFQHEATLGTPTLATSGADTYASIVRK